MARESQRKKIAKYVYQDANGISGIVYLKGHKPAELRFPLRTPLAEIRRAMEVRAAQLQATPPDRPSPGTVAHVITTYVIRLGETLPEQDERGRLRAWTQACGAEPFDSLTKGQLNAIVDEWLRANVAESTIAKRISSLRKVARAVADAQLHDDGRKHAIELIKRPRTPKSGEILGRPMDLVQRVLDNVVDWNQSAGIPSKSKIRLTVWAWTAQNPAQIQLIRPEHVRWTTTPPQLYIQPRRKGAGVDAGWIPLLPQAVTAFREFFARQADGPWDKGTVLRAFNRAKQKTQRQLRQERRYDDAARLEGMQPKDLRHSFATAYQQASGDIHATAEYLRHSDLKTTMRYITGASSARTEAGIAALAAVTTGAAFSKKTRPPFSKEFSKKEPELRGRKAKERHDPPQTAKARKSERAYELATDAMNTGGK